MKFPSEAVNARVPLDLKPQLPTLVEDAPDGDAWIHEIKHDGYRFLAHVSEKNVRLITRNGNDWTDRLPILAKELSRLVPAGSAIDGELIVLDSQGKSDFQKLQQGFDEGVFRAKAVFEVFDAPALNGYDLRRVPLLTRKQLLKEALFTAGSSKLVRFSDHVTGNGPEFFRNACRLKLEGIISKKANVGYEEGRSKTWVKVKCIQRQEFVLCGFTPPKGSRKYFGSIILGLNEDGRLRYAGKVGTGFSSASLRDLHARMLPMVIEDTPLEGTPRAVANEAKWVRPELLGEVAFTEFTGDGQLRHPSFMGIREDKRPDEAIRERPKKMKNLKSDKSSASEKVGEITISNPGRAIFPDAGITKAELAQFFLKIAPWLLPHVARRPLSLVRCPQGREKGCFFQKHFEQSRPPHVFEVPIEEGGKRSLYGYVREENGLVALAQYGIIEIHPWGSRVDQPDKPDVMIFDLDPGDDVPWSEVLGTAFLLRDELESFNLESFIKTSGGKGLHLCIPLERRHGWDQVKGFSKALAERAAQRNPERLTAKASKAVRNGRIYIDYLRNGRGATCVSAYCPRARPQAPVSVPLAWDEVRPELRADQWTIRNLFSRLSSLKRDPWENYDKVRQRLTASALRTLEVR